LRNTDPRILIQDVSRSIGEAVSTVVVGQREAVEDLILGLWTGSHVLLEGLPGLAKTTLVRTLASALGLSYRRIQFTPDLMPADIIGMEVLEEQMGQRVMRFVEGPLFAQILLADEINRTPPKTQSALLQAMQEGQVSVAGKTVSLPKPFIVFATQNPIENEGTYPLPEAQLDRFSLKVVMGYPSLEEEYKISVAPRQMKNVPAIEGISEIDWEACAHYLEDMPVTQSMIEMAVKIVRMSRPESEEADEMVKQNVRWGAGPRASQYLLQVAKARAAMAGKSTPDAEDLAKSALPVLRHRILPTFSADARHIKSEDIIVHLLQQVKLKL
jgi:MoxR-like ATPase